MSDRLHPSALEDWQGCGKRFEFSSVLHETPAFRHPAAVNGTALHETIRLIHAESLWDDMKRIAEAFLDAFDDAVARPKNPVEASVPVWWGEHESQDKAAAAYSGPAAKMLAGYVGDSRNRDAVIIAEESLWRATFGGFDWEGTLDQARAAPDGGIEIVDFKSGKERIGQAPLAMWPQGLTYALALEHALFKPIGGDGHEPWTAKSLRVTKATWCQLRDYIPYERSGRRGEKTWEKGQRRGDVFYSVDVTDRLKDAHAREIAAFAKAVHGGRFERRPSNYQCSRCRFVDACLRDFGSDRRVEIDDADYE